MYINTTRNSKQRVTQKMENMGLEKIIVMAVVVQNAKRHTQTTINNGVVRAVVKYEGFKMIDPVTGRDIYDTDPRLSGRITRLEKVIEIIVRELEFNGELEAETVQEIKTILKPGRSCTK